MCKECGKTFTYLCKKVKHLKERVWFEKWIKEGYSVRQLTQMCHHKKTKVQSIIQTWLEKIPDEQNANLSHHKYILFDGTFLKGRVSILATLDGKENTIISGQYGLKENSIKDLLFFFNGLKERGLYPKSVTVDGNPHAMKALRQVWENIVIQRCLVHIQRQGLMWCRAVPKRTDAKYLRKIFLQVTSIHTKKERDRFLSSVEAFERRFGHSIASAQETGWVFSDLKRARSMLIHALPNMFHYLHDENIPFTTNGLEGYFSRLKTKYRSHRGLSPLKRKNYFSWYFFLSKR